ncbi:hypothetical protein [Eubacterium pyruvativorans]|uniref:hypothetical protein n=1 Tax=Eubacterium pyruvativorans TaxID=155865 RepID=UPI00088AB076|nr:hypothetical protein [Eubacterium pyruvativorans]SDF29745.1 hypothetical protein SAMN04487889_1173 [Eubacterium pyruvativorans]
MHTQIIITPATIFQWLMIIAGGIITIGGAIKVVVGWWKSLHAPDAKRDTQLSKLRADVEKTQEKLEDHDVALREQGHAIDLSMKGMLALLDHALNGNNITQMEDTKEEIRDYLLDRKLKGRE